MHQILVGQVPETHRSISKSLGRCLTHLQVAVPTGAQKLGQVEKIHGELGRSVSQPLLGPHSPNSFWKFLRYIETFLDYMAGVDTKPN